MCFGSDSRPPIEARPGAAAETRRVVLTASDGNRFAAFRARARQPTGAGVLVLPDIRGLNRYYEELAERFAEHGIDALAIDWYGRTASLGQRNAGFDPEPHIAQLRYETLLADVAAAAAELRKADGGRVRALFAVGFCLGGRIGFLATAEGLGLAGVVGFYGRPTGPIVYGGPEPIEIVERVAAPILGIFAGRDEYIPLAGVEAFREALAARSGEHRVIIYPDTPHSFFDILADDYAAASASAWEETLGFIRRHGAADLTSGSGRSA